MKPYVQLLRPQQWIKNVFVLIPAFFAGKIGLILSGPRLTLSVISFCAVASAAYIFNDIVDAGRDRLHELKRERPLATGSAAISGAIVLMILCLVIAVSTALAVGLNYLYVVTGYFGLNLLYSVLLKHLSLVDISLIAIGFVLRVIAGGIAADVPISKWLIMMTFLLACCLALGKRRDDLLLDVDKQVLRPSLKGYTLPFIDASLMILSVTTSVCSLCTPFLKRWYGG